MTTFTGPIKIQPWQVETTAAEIDVSGSAKFAGGANFGGPVALGGTASVSASAQFAGPVQVHNTLKVGSSAADVGDVVLVRQVNLPSSNTKSAATVIPQGSDILDIKMFVQTPPSSSALSTTNVLIGTSAQDARFATFTNVTAQGYYTVPTSTRTSAWNSVSGASSNIIVHTTAASGAIASGASGRISIFYVKRQ